MTITERIQLHKLGYTKEEIKELAEEGYEPKVLVEPPKEPEQVEPPKEPEQVEPPKEPENNNEAILLAIKELTKTIQASNLQKDAQPAQNKESAEDILKQIM